MVTHDTEMSLLRPGVIKQHKTKQNLLNCLLKRTPGLSEDLVMTIDALGHF